MRYANEPEWYLKMRSKVSLRSDRQFLGFFGPLFGSALISGVVIVILLTSIQIGEQYESIITFLVIVITFILLYLITRKYYVLKDAKYDRFNLLAYNCARIGLDLERLLIVPNYNHYLIPNINALRINSWLIRLRNYKTQDDKVIRNSLKLLSKNSFRLTELVKDIDNNREVIDKLSTRYMGLGRHITEDLTPRIHKTQIKALVNELETIEKKVPKTKDRIKSLITTKIGFLFIDIIITAGITFAVYQVTSDINAIITAIFGTFFGIPVLYSVLSKLPSLIEK
jgi:hypothetical protein